MIELANSSSLKLHCARCTKPPARNSPNTSAACCPSASPIRARNIASRANPSPSKTKTIVHGLTTPAPTVRYLKAVTTNNIRDLQAGQGIAALLLNAQGHILAELEIYALPDRLRIATQAMNRERAFTTLEKFIIMDDATLEDVTERFGAIALEGPQTHAVLADLLAPGVEAFRELARPGPLLHVDASIAGIPVMMLRRAPDVPANAERAPSGECAASVHTATSAAADEAAAGCPRLRLSPKWNSSPCAPICRACGPRSWPPRNPTVADLPGMPPSTRCASKREFRGSATILTTP